MCRATHAMRHEVLNPRRCDGGRENASFGAFLYYKRSFYQDRLGTNIGKVEKRDTFLQAHVSNVLVANGTSVCDGSGSVVPYEPHVNGTCCASVLAPPNATEIAAAAAMAKSADIVVRKTPLLESFYAKNDHFTKTGSGQA